MRTVLLFWCLISAASAACMAPALADETESCSHFSWDVSHELAVMKQTPKVITAATKPGTGTPLLQVDTLYELKLAPQGAVTFSAKPAKPTLDDSARGGLVRFHVEQPGLYRISITSGHWIDVIEGEQLIKSKDFQGSHGCSRPHKIVEFDLPAHKDLVLQLSGSKDPSVTVAITPVAASAPAAGGEFSRNGSA
jgi:hypothetical protein